MDHTYPQFMPPAQSRAEHARASGMAAYLDSASYPQVKGDRDPETVALLKEDYAGAHGELTGIAQYVFQHGRTADNETLANALLQIAIVEMTHLDMLGEAIVTLGGSPSFESGQQFWNAKSVQYATDLTEMLRADIQSENTAIAGYERHIAQTRNATVKALLARIIQDEKLHLRFFTEALSAPHARE